MTIEYVPGVRVKISDGIVGVVRSVSVTQSGCRYEVGWWVNGELREAWFSAGELERTR